MLIFHPHEIGIAVGYSRHGRPRIAIGAGERYKPAFAHQATVIWLLSAGLTCATLLVVRRSAQVQMQHQVEQDARNATLTFQVMEHQHQMALGRKADLLASLAYMRNGDATTIKDVSEDPWKSDDCNMFAVADKKGKIIALHSTAAVFPTEVTEEMLRRSLSQGNTSAWWINNRIVYQVVLQRF
jgi:hypothetical protein